MSEYISREEFENRIKLYDTEDHTDKALYNFAHNHMICCPSADARPNIHGHWEKPKGEIKPFGDDTVQCSECGFFTEKDSTYIYNFCPVCGADMREPKGGERNRMTREEAIERMKTMRWEHATNPSPDREAFDMAISALSDYNKMQKISLDLAFENDELMNKSRWIPVSERLPEESGRYLTYIVNEYDEELKYIMIADYIARPRPIEGLSPWNPDDECVSDNVIAWQPLPEPYKAESEEA